MQLRNLQQVHLTSLNSEFPKSSIASFIELPIHNVSYKFSTFLMFHFSEIYWFFFYKVRGWRFNLSSYYYVYFPHFMSILSIVLIIINTIWRTDVHLTYGS